MCVNEQMGELSKRLYEVFCSGRCPACDAAMAFLKGPEGGLNQNFKCSKCGNKFNVGPYLAQWIGCEPPLRKGVP